MLWQQNEKRRESVLFDLQIAQGNLDDGVRNSSVGSVVPAESTFTTPHVEEDSATEWSSGMKASPPSVSFASLTARLSARGLR